MKVALVHDFLSQDGGAEKVLSALQEIWPEAPTFALFYDKKKLPQFKEKDIRVSFLQNFPGILKKYQWFLPLMPLATESYTLSDFDVVFSNASAFSKGVITQANTLNICYCHTPTRYLWSDAQSYLRELGIPKIIRLIMSPMMSLLRIWDFVAAKRPQKILANSKTVQNRIKHYYQRESTVIHPPVDIDFFTNIEKERLIKTPYFLCGGRLVPYKRFDLIIEAANRLKIPLIIFGTGPLKKQLKKQAGSTITFVGKVSAEKLRNLYTYAEAFIHPQEEDFGITPIEAMATGCPVIAYNKGGATETIIDQQTGILFNKQNWESLADILANWNKKNFSKDVIKTHAQKFSKKRFQKEIKSFVNKALQEKNS